MAKLEVRLNMPRVEKNKVLYSWDSKEGFLRSSYEVQYPGLESLEASLGKLTTAYFPVCLAFAAFGDVTCKLPVRIDDSVLKNWHHVIEVTARKLYKRSGAVHVENGDCDPAYKNQSFENTAVFFGGGTESLLTLARLGERGLRPYLISFGGPGWMGSDPEANPDKFTLDKAISAEKRLELISVLTDFRQIIDDTLWRPYLKKDVSMINAALAMPFFISFLLPVAERYNLGLLVNGNERMGHPDDFFCFSPAMTSLLSTVSRDVRYESHLTDLLKEEVCRELYIKYPEYAKYQYSCWKNRKERWCHRCDSCLEYYMLLKANQREASLVGMYEKKIKNSMLRLVIQVAISEESFSGEIWSRLCKNQVLRKDTYLANVLDAIRLLSFIYHNFYGRAPVRLRSWLGFSRIANILKSRPMLFGRKTALLAGEKPGPVYLTGIRKTDDGKYSRLSCHVDWPGCASLTLWIEVPSEYGDFLHETSYDAFLAAVLPLAMVSGQDVQVDGGVTAPLMERVDKIMGLFAAWFPRDCRQVEVSQDPAAAGPQRPPGKAVGCFFSGGVDSFYSLLMHRIAGGEAITHLLTVQGFDVPLDNNLFDKVLLNNGEIAKTHGVRLLPVRTNLRELSDLCMDWLYYYGAAMASVGLALSGGVSRLIIPSASHAEDMLPGGSHPDLDPLWNNGRVEFVHDGLETKRLEKIRSIIGNESVSKYLRVCWQNRLGKYNCSECEKCLRTMIEIYAEGGAGKINSFVWPVTFAKICRVRALHLSAPFWREVVRSLGSGNEVLRLKVAIRIMLFKSALLNFKDRMTKPRRGTAP